MTRVRAGWIALAITAGVCLGWATEAREQVPASSPPAIEKVEQGDDWFEVYRIFPGVFAIHEPEHWERVTSYLVVGAERALLFDTGTGTGDIRSVISELTELEAVVVNSHSHSDHVGGNDQFETVFGSDLLRDGEAIDLGGRSLEVLLTPGHAPDALCLVDREQRFVLTGDTFYLGRLFVHDGPSLGAYAASATRLAALAGDVDRILPAHSATMLKAVFLRQLDRAFQAILRGDARGQDFRGRRVSPEGSQRKEYQFGGFSIVTAAE